MNGQISHDFSVNLDIGSLHHIYQSTVARTVNLGCSIDSRDPQSPEITLFPATISIGELKRSIDRLCSDAVDL
jgi:hypothetical protein